MSFKTPILLALVALVVSDSQAYKARNKTGNHGKHSLNDSNPIVTTPLGQIEGTTMTSRLGRTIYAFRGVRYAKPPINELRFKPPVPVEKYEGVYNATADRVICPQPSDTAPTDEDCLFLNVYSTKLPNNSTDSSVKRPVIVHLHAGGFYSVGSVSYWTGPQYFLDQDIVLVTLNYRLGTLGFLSTGDASAPGNNGLKDQVEVLRWVHRNIAAFGGDPDSVTLLGYSAGSISSILHMLSPMSKGLFHRVIAMSASPTAQWPIPNNLTDLAKKQAEIVGCPDNTNITNVLECLKKTPANTLGNSLNQFYEFHYTPVLLWRPVIENDFGQERFLTAHPVKLIQEGNYTKVPIILGVTTEEFANIAVDVINNSTLLNRLNSDWERLAPINFQYDPDTAITADLKKFYLDDKTIDRSSMEKLGQLYGDSIIGFGVNRAAKLLSQTNSEPVYYYKFSYQGDYSHYYTPESNYTKPYGVVHHDDLIYLFYISTLFPEFKEKTPKEVEMVEKLTTLHYNFAKYGNPIPSPSETLDNVTWTPFKMETQKYMDIGKTLEMKTKLYDDRYAEWEKLFPLNKY